MNIACKPGRPLGSAIRQRIVEILAIIKRGYGYEIHKIYVNIFPSCTRENIYYHLRKGVKTGVFIVDEIKQEKGDWSWGQSAEKTYYSLGPQAEIRGSAEVTAWAKQNR